MNISHLDAKILLFISTFLIFSCTDLQIQSDFSSKIQSDSHPTKGQKPNKAWCDKLGYKNYGKCVSEWAQEELVSNFVTYPNNLNIVYFVPNDNPAVENYKERLSKLLIYFQDYVKSEMDRNGFGKKTFGLPIDTVNHQVNIITIQGQHDQTTYDYGSGSAILDEINAYQDAHPEEFSSQHNLILLPQRTDGGRQPFYGWGRHGFAVDNPNIKVKEIEVTESNLIAGMFHELGHGLNLPHNGEKSSQVETLGTALMGSGNYTWGREPTFITEAHAAILNRNQIFQSTPVPDIYESANTTLSPQINYDAASNSLHVEGTYTSNKAVSDVLFYLDPKISESDGDYNSATWRQSANGSSFSATLSFDEIPAHGDYPYALRIKLLMENGSISSHGYAFEFENGEFKLNPVGVYQHSNYNGWGVELEVGSYTTSQLEALGGVDNDISSIRVPLGQTVTLYSEDNFTGNSYEVGPGSVWFLSSFNDKTSSIIVSEQ